MVQSEHHSTNNMPSEHRNTINMPSRERRHFHSADSSTPVMQIANGCLQNSGNNNISSPSTRPLNAPDKMSTNPLNVPEGEITDASDEERFMHYVDVLASKADELEKKVEEVSKLFVCRDSSKWTLTSNKNGIQGAPNNVYKNDNNGCKKKPVGGYKKLACSKRMRELMRQFGTILRQISQHKWAGPFMDPVNVKTLGLDDYYEVIKKPMDLSTIRKRLETKGVTFYTNVSDIYADTRLVFRNAMTYNDENSDIHAMANTLLAKVEEKWLQLWPKVVEEENRQKEEDAYSLASVHVAIEKMASDTDSELHDLNLQLEELSEMVVQKCRKWSTEEKRKLGIGLSSLSAENLNKALEIVAQCNPTFQALGKVVEFDMDAQSEATLWRLKFFVKEAMAIQMESFTNKATHKSRQKRRRDTDLTKSGNKRNKRLASC